MNRITDLRAYVVGGADQGADYHAQPAGHWITSTVIATPMSKYPQYAQTRESFGIGVLGTAMVEVEADDGTVGFAVTTGGVPACYLIEHHFKRFVVGRPVTDVEIMWDQMFNASLFYGRKGLTINAISAVDLAVWDLLGRLRGEPVYAMLGGKVRDTQPMYATTPRPDLARQMGFTAGKIPLPYGPADAEEGLARNTELAAKMRQACGPEFPLAFDCWMALTTAYALKLIKALEPCNFRWIEECLPPDDYAGYRQLVRQRSHPILITTGEHEYTRYGFQNLLETGVDIIQPDVNWCGGMTELLKIRAMASARGRLVVPHGSSVYSYHFAIASHETPFAEFLMMAPAADRIVPMFDPLFTDEPVPAGGYLDLPDKPGFGVELNPKLHRERPFVVTLPGHKSAS